MRSMLLRSVVVASLAVAGSAVSAQAALINDIFSFYNSNNQVLATGNFSYDSTHSGTLGYSQLASFSVSFPSSPGQTYDLAFALASTPYRYFAYDTTTNTFVPGVVNGYGTTMAAAWDSATQRKGFFFDALASQANVNNNDGILEAYSPNTGYLYATRYTIAQTPLPAALPLFASGAGLLGLLGLRRKKKARAVAA